MGTMAHDSLGYGCLYLSNGNFRALCVRDCSLILDWTRSERGRRWEKGVC
jgi:hypothetical protein